MLSSSGPQPGGFLVNGHRRPGSVGGRVRSPRVERHNSGAKESYSANGFDKNVTLVSINALEATLQYIYVGMLQYVKVNITFADTVWMTESKGTRDNFAIYIKLLLPG